MMTLDEMQQILLEIKYDKPDWFIVLGGNGDTDVFLQVQFWDVDVDAPELGKVIQKCRKWRLSKHMTKSEVVMTAWKAIQAAEMHEAAEKFLYKGVRIFNPHVDVDALVDLYAQENVLVRRA